MKSKQTGLSRRIYDMLRLQIDSGTLKLSEKMPSTRELALEQGVSRSSVVAIYEQLASDGYIDTAQGKLARVASVKKSSAKSNEKTTPRRPHQTPELSSFGRRVANLTLPRPPSNQSGQINFLHGALADSSFPKLLWRRAYVGALMKRQDLLFYGAPEGEIELRAQLQGYLLRARGVSCLIDQIVIVQGSQQAIDLCARLLVDHKKTVFMEEPGYLMARRSFEATGANLVSISVDEDGLSTKELSNVRGALVYVTPSHQYPLGGVLPIPRRHALLSWAAANHGWIVEDDYDSEFRYGLRPTETLQSLDTNETVIYVGTFSKALSPELRVGYLVLPLTLVPAFRNAKQLIDRHVPKIEQLALAELIKSGAYERHVRRGRRENEKRRTVLLQAIANHLPTSVQVEGTSSGLHMVVWFNDFYISHERAIVTQAQAHGVGVWPITPLYSEGQKFRAKNCAGFVFGYAGIAPAQITIGIKRLALALEEVRNQSKVYQRTKGA